MPFIGRENASRHQIHFLVIEPAFVYVILILFTFLVGCNQSEVVAGPTATVKPTATLKLTHPAVIQSPTVTPRNTVVPDTGWLLMQPGLERRVINQRVNQDQSREYIFLLRIDPHLFKFDVAYAPGSPKSLDQWQMETRANIVVNGGFFTDSFEATGLIIVNGRPYGKSYSGFGGMLTISQDGPMLRSLKQHPYIGEELISALQSFPMLVLPGGLPGYPQEDGLSARRTVIGQDSLGRMIIMVASTGSFTLHQLSRFLIESDLQLVIALNLDGGASSGILLAESAEGVPAFSLLPAVITVHPK